MNNKLIFNFTQQRLPYRTKDCFISIVIAIILYIISLATLADTEDHPTRKMNGGGKPVDENTITFGLESNIYGDSSFVSPSVDFALKHGWDIQLATYNIPTSQSNLSGSTWDTYINVSKTYEATDNFRIVLGTQNGVSLAASHKQIHMTHFGLLSWKAPTERKIILQAGTYWANKASTLTTDVVGFLGTAYVDLIPKQLQLQASYLDGAHNLGGANVNFIFKSVPYVKPYIGIGVPAFNSGNEFYGTVGISYTTPGFQ